MNIKQAATGFLANERIAVTGVSRAPKGHGGNVVYQRLRQHGISVIDGGCPLMFDPCADGGHKLMRFMFTMTGKVPRTV